MDFLYFNIRGATYLPLCGINQYRIGNLDWDITMKTFCFSGKLRILALSILSTLPIALLFCSSSSAKDKARVWNQEVARQKVMQVIEQERDGDFAWDKINWLTDPQEAHRVATREKKPIFVFFFLKKDVGPKAAPC